MLTYIVSGSNTYTLRTQPATGNAFTMSLQNMTTQVNTTASLSGVNYQTYESMLNFTASIDGAYQSEEYRAVISDGISDVWHGSIQLLHSQSWENLSKSDYKNQNDQYISNVSENKYIIMQ